MVHKEENSQVENQQSNVHKTTDDREKKKKAHFYITSTAEPGRREALKRIHGVKGAKMASL